MNSRDLWFLNFYKFGKTQSGASSFRCKRRAWISQIFFSSQGVEYFSLRYSWYIIYIDSRYLFFGVEYANTRTLSYKHYPMLVNIRRILNSHISQDFFNNMSVEELIFSVNNTTRNILWFYLWAQQWLLCLERFHGARYVLKEKQTN